MQQHINQIKTKYAVKLGLNRNSFYDPLSGCNLFLKTPYYCFDNEPTKGIINAVKSGALIDLKGNILNNNKTKEVEIKKEVVDSTEEPTKKKGKK